MDIYGGGNLIEVRQPAHVRGKRRTPGSGGRKQELQGFSAQSRLHLARELAKVDWSMQPAHVTLTYGGVWPIEPKADLERIRIYFRRLGCFGVWRLEFQARGLWHVKGSKAYREGAVRRFDSSADAWVFAESANRGVEPVYVPHYHLLACGLDESHEDRVRAWWARATGNDSRFACHISYREAGRAGWYLAMHSTKMDQSPDLAVGRWWGWIDGPRVKAHQRREDYGALDRRQNIRLCRIARRLSGGRVRPPPGQSFSLFLGEHEQQRLLRYLATLEEHKQN